MVPDARQAIHHGGRIHQSGRIVGFGVGFGVLIVKNGIRPASKNAELDKLLSECPPRGDIPSDSIKKSVSSLKRTRSFPPSGCNVDIFHYIVLTAFLYLPLFCTYRFFWFSILLDEMCMTNRYLQKWQRQNRYTTSWSSRCKQITRSEHPTLIFFSICICSVAHTEPIYSYAH